VDVSVYLEDTSAAVLLDSPTAAVVIEDTEASVLMDNPTATVTLEDTSALVVCDDVLALTFTTPTLTAWHANAIDNGSLGCTVYFTATTAGSPCRVRFHLIDTETYKGAFSSPDQNTTHASNVTITGTGNRGKSYDLKWSWTSGNEGVVQELILADAVYIPASGEGDQLSEG
jgi:hypothetical protein